MNPTLNLLHVTEKQRQMRRLAAIRRRATPRGGARPAAPSLADTDTDITVRLADAGDRDDVLRLAELEGREVPRGDLLLGLVDGIALAALPVSGGPAIADPFRPSAAVVERLRAARAHLHGGGRPSVRARIGAALGRLFDDGPPRGGVRAPAVPGTERSLIR